MEVGLAVGGAILSSALNVFFDRMTPKFPDLFRGRKDDEKILKELKRMLRAIEAVLDDAENKHITETGVKDWLIEVKDTVYNAEDLVDEINTEILRLRAEGVSNVVSTPLPHEFLNKIIPEIKEVVQDLKDFESQITTLGLMRHQHDMNKQATSSSRLPSTSLVDELEVCGRDEEREKLTQMMLNENGGGNGNSFGVIPIVGMGGLGKTTLAQLVYNDESVKQHFHIRAWVCVSENYDAFKITQTLVAKVSYEGVGKEDDLDRLQVKLNTSLKDKKFLIVLDDVWNGNYNDWDKLKAPFKGGKQGSVILVTTRHENVANIMRTRNIFKVDRLPHEDCLSLFKKHAFTDDHAFAIQEFERIGEKIMKKCDGLPLAIKTMGGLLRAKTSVEEWNNVLDSDIWNLDDESNEILPTLRLSYHHLPPHLKHCFAFCAIFPKNYTFNEEEFVLLWMANDLLERPHQDKKMSEPVEDVGRKYFSQLRLRSFFEKKSDGGYLMHDLINDLARYVSQRFCVRFEDNQPCEISRHFSYMPTSTDAFGKFESLAQAKRLRTFLPTSSDFMVKRLNERFLWDRLPELGRLRVLSLCGYRMTELSSSIGNLKHLRYINLSKTDIRQLPDVICSLYNLETLLLSGCRRLDELPEDITKLVNLRHLALKDTNLKKMPSHVSKLRSLQTLSYFIVDNSAGRSIEELGKLSLHGYLKINGLQNVGSCSDALKACLKDKKQLEDLVLQWNGDIDDSQTGREIFDKLRPHTKLKTLEIDGYGGTSFPDWLADNAFCKIVSLSLIRCENCCIMPKLGHLTSLKHLTINGLGSVTRIGEEFYGDYSSIRAFASLVTLIIEEMYGLKEWDTPPCADFSSLEKLTIERCPNLKELPEGVLGSQLKFLRIASCDGLVSVPKVMAHVNELFVSDCLSLVSLPILAAQTSISNCPKLEFPESENSDDLYSAVENLELQSVSLDISVFHKLQRLSLGNCKSLKVLSFLRNFTLLRKLHISHCGELLCFPEGGLPAPNLERLHVYGCKKLKSLPEQMHSLLPSLRDLWIRRCSEIECFPREGLPSSLNNLRIVDCEKLRRNPIRDWGLQRLLALEVLGISVSNEEESFPDKGLVPCSLRILSIYGGEKLKTLNEKGLLCLTSLKSLYINRCPNFQSLPIKGLPASLKSICIRVCPNFQSLPKNGLPTSLKYLFIERCPNFQSISVESLPTSLECLSFSHCPNFQSLPEEGLPTSLCKLNVEECPKLTSHLERETGIYWPIISHIPSVKVNDRFIS